MRARVLGSAAGGGFPQWNCGCPSCVGVREKTIAAAPRTQASLAVSGDGERWILLGASPDLRAQLDATPELWPRPGARGSPIAAIALPNGDVDAWLGLLSLREWTPLELYATSRVRCDLLDENVVLRTLDRFSGQTRWRALEPGARLPLPGGLTIEAIPAQGKPPLHLADRRGPDPLDNVGLVIGDRSGVELAWFPSVAAPSGAVEQALLGADVIFFDGTFYSDDELARSEPSAPGARQMGHWPVGGAEGSAPFLAGLPSRQKWLVHVNNTNPLLLDDSPERARLRALGIEVAHDGLTWRS